MVLVSGRVVCLVAVESAQRRAVNNPCERIRLPVNGIGVPVRVSVGRRQVLLVAIWDIVSHQVQPNLD